MGYYDGNWGAGQWLAMTAMMVIFWGLVILLVVWAMRSYHGADPRIDSSAESGADEVLATRYARGEIDEEEFCRRRESLHSALGTGS